MAPVRMTKTQRDLLWVLYTWESVEFDEKDRPETRGSLLRKGLAEVIGSGGSKTRLRITPAGRAALVRPKKDPAALPKYRTRMPEPGERFGMLVVQSIVHQHRVKAVVACDCGATKSVYVSHLKRGATRSCGCNPGRKVRHGRHGSPEYMCWQSIIQRCTNPNSESYRRYYGGRGITVCDRWRDFENFFADMGPRPSPQHSIDRIDVNGNYEPGNCRWATDDEQVRNTRRNVFVEVNGERMCLKDACCRVGINYGTVINRLKSGWSMSDALSRPVIKQGRAA